MTDTRANDLSVVETRIIHNALGLLYEKKPYRRHFVAPPEGENRDACERLVSLGLMSSAPKSAPSGNHTFFVTESGAALLGHSLPD